MNQTNLFLMPDYFPLFSCKMGACRTVCCSGWQVSITLDNYFALIGTDCSEELRRKMDCALKPVDYPDEGKYATIHPNYFGECPLRLADGRCGVQAELGEDILPDICRLYPRGVRCHGDHYEISLANSCEAVPELFLKRKEPIAFIEREWSMKLPPMPAEELGSWAQRKACIDVLQDRSRPLSARLASLGGRREKQVSEETTAALCALLQALCEHSESIRLYGEKAIGYLAENGYAAARERLETLLPDCDIFFEHLMVNHVFFSRYPFSERGLPVQDKFAALAAVYALVRLMALGNAKSLESLVDAVSAAFRLISHTDFDRTALHLLHKYSLMQKVEELITV
ncbi:MAG: hypothetical protein E7599_02115 [Ruminococcaceae bacterium]|nr:hypothetical protein [Oscillospiraceae bacterium]